MSDWARYSIQSADEYYLVYASDEATMYARQKYLTSNAVDQSLACYTINPRRKLD